MRAGLIVGIVMVVTICDAYRDRWMPDRCRGEKRRQWHWVKWVAFFTPLGYMVFDYFEMTGVTVENVAFVAAFAGL